jgi:hypothetical protein
VIQSLLFKGRVYDTLKWLTIIVLPGLGTLYQVLASIWGFPRPEDVAQTVLAICAFLGLILGISSANYAHSDARFDGTAYMDRLDPTNNPDIVLKDDGKNVPKQLVLKVQETQPAVVKPEPGDGVVKTEGGFLDAGEIYRRTKELLRLSRGLH